MREYDFSITADEHGDCMLLHKPDCNYVRIWRERGRPICTMLGCKGIPDVERCSCLENVEIARSAAG
jgi:hypothetical protein